MVTAGLSVCLLRFSTRIRTLGYRYPLPFFIHGLRLLNNIKITLIDLKESHAGKNKAISPAEAL
jgi:hypothetical protein